MHELRPGLYRWTALHPEWEPDAEPDSPEDWPQEVASVACRTSGAFVLIDPLVTDGWDELDALVAAHSSPVHVLTTIRVHERSASEAIARYDAVTEPPSGVEPVVARRANETLFWLPGPRAVVAGDRIVGFAAPGCGLRLCPESWMRITHAELREELRPLLDLPVELVLPSHGDPVLENGHAALAAILGGHAQSSSATAR